MLKKLGIPRMERELRDQHGSLSFAVFHATFSDFPFYFGTTRLDKLHLDARTLLPALIKNFRAAPFMQAFLEFQRDVVREASARTPGLIFPRKGVPHGMIIYASEDLESVPFFNGETVTTFSTTDRGRRQHFLLRSFSRFLSSLVQLDS